MNQSLEVTNIKKEPTDSTSSDRMKISTEMQMYSYKQEDSYIFNTELDIKAEVQEDENEFPVIANTSYDLYSSYDMKIETDVPIIKTEFENVLFKILTNPLDVGTELEGSCDEACSSDVEFDKNEPMINIEYGSPENDNMQDPLEDTSIMKVEEHFSIDLEECGVKIKTESTEGAKVENLLESDENTESHRSASNFHVQHLIRNDPDSNDKKYICNECNKTFKWKCHLDEHLRIHTDEKPFTCNVCKKSFTSKSSLYTHMLIHSDKKPHSCDICQKVFCRKSRLICHKLIHSDVKQFSCDVCKKSFARKQELVVHKRIHTGEKPFSCTMCNKTFVTSSHLMVHTRTHTGEKPYSCNICNKSFAKKENLNRHKNIHKR